MISNKQALVVLDFLINDGALPLHLDTQLQLFCNAAFSFYRGQLDEFIAADLLVHVTDEILRSESLFLLGAAYARRGELEKAEPFWQQANTSAAQATSSIIRDRIQIERCMFDLNRGLKKRAVAKLLHFKWNTVPDPFYVTRAYAGVVICLIDLARFDEAEHFLAQEFRYIQNLQSRLFLQGYERLRVLLELLTERHEQAFERLQSALIHLPQNSLSKAYLLEMLFEAQVNDGSVKDAMRAYRQMRNLRRELGLHKQYYASIEHRVEVDLLRQNPRAIRFAKRIVRSCRQRGDFFSLARGFIYLGRAQHAFQDPGSTRSFERALALCEKHNYEVVELECLQHYCGSLWQQNDRERFQQSLLRMETKSAANGWMVLHAATSIVRSWHEGQSVEYSVFLDVLMRSRWPLLAKRYLEKYKYLDNLQLTVNDALGHIQVLSESQFRSKTIYDYTHLWFCGEYKMLYVQHRRLKSFDLHTLGTKLGALAHQLFESSKPFSLSQIHKLYSSVAYHPLKHSAAIHSLLARLRVFLNEIKLKLVFENDSYSIKRPSTWARVECLQKSGNRLRELNKRQLVLEMLQHRGMVPTSALCEALGIKRQTLHPLLKKLEQEGLISLVSSGPRSGYRKN